MPAQKPGYEDFIREVPAEAEAFAADAHKAMLGGGASIEVKEAKSGYVVSYLFRKKTILNFVFRKKGMLVRLYANHIGAYEPLLESLPDGMKQTIAAAPICKRLSKTAECNPKCAEGYEFVLDGATLRKCRYNAFLIPVAPETAPFLLTLIGKELEACRAEKA